MAIRINLTEAELFICRTLGVMRRSAAMHKVIDQQMGNQDTWGIDIDGVVGEFCAAKAMNVCPDLTVGIRKGGADLLTKEGKTVDVKTTRHKSGRLLATLKKVDLACDIYLLVIVDDFGGDVIGWTTKTKLFNEKNKTNLGHGVGYGMEQDHLKQVN